jgi:hypothetical protein
MPAAIVIGKPGAIEQYKIYSGGPNKPDQVIQKFRGPRAAILAMIVDMKSKGYDWQIEEGPGPTATLEFTTPTLTSEPGGENPVDTWELLPGEVEKDVMEANLALLNSISADEKRMIRDAIQNPTPGESPALTTTNAIDLYLLMLSGLRAVRVFAPVLRRTRTVSSSYGIPQANTNVGRLLSNSTVANEGIPSGFLLGFDGVYATGSARTGYVYGWYKKPPTLQKSWGTRIQISQEWEFGFWPTLIYGSLI